MYKQAKSGRMQPSGFCSDEWYVDFLVLGVRIWCGMVVVVDIM